jgi:DeoR family glycerol-3-phosphate regulon repressor
VFVEERQEKIIELLNQNFKVRVKELSEAFAVTEDCIRKDLAVLERRGLLKRTYGGAVPLKLKSSFSPASEKNGGRSGRLAMARKAASLVQDGDMVFLDIATANVELARLFATFEKRITVVTNMIDVLNLLRQSPHIQIIFTGGILARKERGFFDSMARSVIARLKIDLAFLGAAGINIAEKSIFSDDIEDGINKAAIIKASRRAFVMAEKAKFDRDGSYSYAVFGGVDGFIIDESLAESQKSELKKMGLEII